MARVEVEYRTFKGWKSSIAQARKWSDLPPLCQEYVAFIERDLGVPIQYIGVGVGRKDMVVRSP
jgi:adenylosuccinate synthase